MELLGEILFEIYGELMLLIVPDKHRTPKFIILSKIIAITVLVLAIALAIWGGVLIFDLNNMLGIIPLTIAVVISLVQIIAGIVLYNKNH